MTETGTTLQEARAAAARSEERLQAATDGWSAAEAALSAYVARVDQGLATSPATLGDKRAAVDLAAMEVESAQRGTELAREQLVDAVREHALSVAASGVGELDRLETNARQAIADALAEARRIAEEFLRRRDEIAADLVAAATEARAGHARIDARVDRDTGRPVLVSSLPDPGQTLGLLPACGEPTAGELRRRPERVVLAGGPGVAVQDPDTHHVHIVRGSHDVEQDARRLVAEVVRDRSAVPAVLNS